MKKTTNLFRLLLILHLIGLIYGCSGKMQGMLREGGSSVTVDYNQNLLHDSLRIQMPDGELFTGKAVMTGHSTGLGVGVSASPMGAIPAFGVVQSFSGSMEAVLFGSNGHTMKCRFQYADSTGLTNMGGIGLCETSKGIVIDLQW